MRPGLLLQAVGVMAGIVAYSLASRGTLGYRFGTPVRATFLGLVVGLGTVVVGPVVVALVLDYGWYVAAVIVIGALVVAEAVYGRLRLRSRILAGCAAIGIVLAVVAPDWLDGLLTAALSVFLPVLVLAALWFGVRRRSGLPWRL